MTILAHLAIKVKDVDFEDGLKGVKRAAAFFLPENEEKPKKRMCFFVPKNKKDLSNIITCKNESIQCGKIYKNIEKSKEMN